MGTFKVAITIAFLTLTTFTLCFGEAEDVSTELSSVGYEISNSNNNENQSVVSESTEYSSTASANTEHSTDTTISKAENIQSTVESSVVEILTSTSKPEEKSLGYKQLCSKGTGCKCPNKYSDSTSVDCNHVKLQEIPYDVKFPRIVKKAEFQGNEISTIEKDIFVKGEEVITLDLSQNKINDVAERAFQNLSNLEKLDLSHNNLWTLKQHIFYGLKNLKDLDLSYNQIRLFYPELFKQCPRLKKLNMDFNPIVINEDKFDYLDNLEILSLKRTGIKDLPDNFAQNLQNLKSLLISDNGIYKVPTVALAGFPNLKTLDISGNPIVFLPAYSFKELKSLTTLYVNHMALLLSVENFAFSGLVNLKSLHLSFNHMLYRIQPFALILNDTVGKTIPLIELYLHGNHTLGPTIPLTELYLRRNNLENLPPNLLDWRALQDLDLSENPWNCDCKMTWIYDLQINKKFLRDARCHKPERLSDEQLSNISRRELTCDSEVTGARTVMILGIIAMVFLVVIVAVIAVKRVRRSKRVVRKKRYRKNYSKVTSDGETIHYEKSSSIA